MHPQPKGWVSTLRNIQEHQSRDTRADYDKWWAALKRHLPSIEWDLRDTAVWMPLDREVAWLEGQTMLYTAAQADALTESLEN